MNTFITPLKPIFSPARTKNSPGFTHFNVMLPGFRCALVMLSLLAGAGVNQAQQKVDPLTITNTGNIGIGTPAPKSKLSVEGSVDVSGNVGIGTLPTANKLSVAGNADVSGKLSVTGNTDVSGKLSVTGNADFAGVGIGTISGTSKLKIANSTSDFAHFRFGDAGAGELEFVGWANGWNINSKLSGRHLYLNRDANTNSDVLIGRSTKEMVIKGDTGNVGIGTTSPTKAKLEISGSASYDLGKYGYLNSSGTTGTYTAGRLPYSLWASNAVAAPEFQTYSDARIKNIQGRSDSATDLRTLLSIEVTNYRYKDVIGNGNGTYKKVTGQQVEKVFPQAVSKQTEVVPDIYRQASIEDGWIALTTDLKKGERVQLISEQATGVYEVLEVGQGRFRTDLKATENRIFVYGREVKDFLSVDYGALSMLNVSATQQIKKEKDEEVKALQEENAALRSQLAGQFSRLAAQEQRLTELEAKDKAREERLAALEALLLAGVNQASRATSLKKVE